MVSVIIVRVASDQNLIPAYFQQLDSHEEQVVSFQRNGAYLWSRDILENDMGLGTGFIRTGLAASLLDTTPLVTSWQNSVMNPQCRQPQETPTGPCPH